MHRLRLVVTLEQFAGNINHHRSFASLLKNRLACRLRQLETQTPSIKMRCLPPLEHFSGGNSNLHPFAICKWNSRLQERAGCHFDFGCHRQIPHY